MKLPLLLLLASSASLVNAGVLDGIKDTVGGAVDTVKDKAGDIIDDATGAAGDAIDGAKDKADDAKDKAGDILEGEERYYGDETGPSDDLTYRSFVELDRSGKLLKMGVKISGAIADAAFPESAEELNYYVGQPEESAISPFQAISVTPNNEITGEPLFGINFFTWSPLELSFNMPASDECDFPAICESEEAAYSTVPCLMPQGWEQLKAVPLQGMYNVPSGVKGYEDGPAGCEVIQDPWSSGSKCIWHMPTLGTFKNSITFFAPLVSVEYMESLKEDDYECFSFGIGEDTEFSRSGFYPLQYCVARTDSDTWEVSIDSFEYYSYTESSPDCGEGTPVTVEDQP